MLRANSFKLGRKSGSGFTLIELLVVIAIIALLAAILFPVFARARANARRSACQSNMKQIGLGIMMYTQDYDDTMPLGEYETGTAAFAYCLPFAGQWESGDCPTTYCPMWMDYIYPYTKNSQIYYCPEGPPDGYDGTVWTQFASTYNVSPMNYGYAFNGNVLQEWGVSTANGCQILSYDSIVPLSKITTASNTIMLTDRGEADRSWEPGVHGQPTDATWGANPSYRHPGNTSDYLFVDGHVKAQTYSLSLLATMNTINQ